MKTMTVQNLTGKKISAYFAESYIAEATNKPGWIDRLNKAQGRLTRAQELSQVIKRGAQSFPPMIPPGMGR